MYVRKSAARQGSITLQKSVEQSQQSLGCPRKPHRFFDSTVAAAFQRRPGSLSVRDIFVCSYLLEVFCSSPSPLAVVSSYVSGGRGGPVLPPQYALSL